MQNISSWDIHKSNFLKFQGLRAYNLAKILQRNGEFSSTVYNYKSTDITFGKILNRLIVNWPAAGEKF